MDLVALTLSLLALAGSITASALSYRTRCKATPQTREEKIEQNRAFIAACKAAEVTLGGSEEFGALMLLSQYRANAAAAKIQLQLLGIEA